MTDGAGGAPVVEVTTRKTSWIRRSVWFLAIFAVIAVVILGDFQAISAASSTMSPSREEDRGRGYQGGHVQTGDPDEFRKMRDQYKAKKASQGASGGGTRRRAIRVRSGGRGSVERAGRARPSDDGLGGVASAQSSTINARGRGAGTRRTAASPRT